MNYKEIVNNYSSLSISNATGCSTWTIYRIKTGCTKITQKTIDKIESVDISKLIENTNGFPVPAEVYNYPLNLVRELAGLNNSDLYYRCTVTKSKLDRINKALKHLKGFNPEEFLSMLLKENDYNSFKVAEIVGCSHDTINRIKGNVGPTISKKLYYIWKEN